MISQLPGNFRVDKLLCEACDVVCLDCAVRRLESPLVPAKVPIDPGFVFASGGSSDLSQAKSQRMQKSQASQSLCHYAVVEPSLLPALCCSRLRVEDNQSVHRHLYKDRNTGHRRIQDDCSGRDERCGDRKDRFACRTRTVKTRVITGETVDQVYVAQQLVIRRCEIAGLAIVGGCQWSAGVWVNVSFCEPMLFR